MCDYSLCGLPNRLAVEGEELMVHKFGTGTVGLASPIDLARDRVTVSPRKGFWQSIKSMFEDPAGSSRVTAVCVPPGAQLLLKNIPEGLQQRWNVSEEETVFFVQLSANVNSHRDAMRFFNGTEALLQVLTEGILVRVLSLGEACPEDERHLAELTL